MAPTGAAHEAGLVRFIVPARRNRFRQALTNERLRSKLSDHLDPRQLDERYAKLVSRDARPTDIRHRLTDLGAPGVCWIVSDDPHLDGRFVPLDEALGRLLFQDAIGFVSCVPGRLGLFSDEAPGDQWILRRDG